MFGNSCDRNCELDWYHGWYHGTVRRFKSRDRPNPVAMTVAFPTISHGPNEFSRTQVAWGSDGSGSVGGAEASSSSFLSDRM